MFEQWHREQADLYGLSGRVSHVVGLGAVVEDFAASFAGDEQALDRLLTGSASSSSRSSTDGADVIVPAGALPSLLLRDENGLTVGHAPVVNSVAVTLKATEAWVRIRDLTGLEPSRGPSFALAPPGAIADFRDVLARGRQDVQRPG